MPGPKSKQTRSMRSGPRQRASAAVPRRREPHAGADRREVAAEAERRDAGGATDPKRHRQLVERIAALTGASRVLLLLDGAEGLAVAAAKLPAGEDAAELRAAITPWVDEARRSRRARLRHGPQGAPAVEQRSCIVAPLLDGRVLLGALYVDVDGASGRLDAADRDLVATLAEQAAVAHAGRLAAMDQAKEIEQRNAELAVIDSIQQGLVAELDFLAIIDLVGDQLRAVLGVGDLSILWWDGLSDEIQVSYSYEHDVRLSPRPIRLRPGRAMWRILHGREVLVVRTRAELEPMGFTLVPGTDQCRSCIGLPILGSTRAVGALIVENHERDGAFGEPEVRLLSTIAASMGVALENARLFAETQRLLKETERRNAELAVINSIQQGIAGSLSFRAIVELVGDKLREVLRIDTIGIRWYDHATRTAHFLYEIERGTRVTMAPVTTSEARWNEVTSDRSAIVRNTAAEVAAAGVAPGTECSLSTVTAKIVAGDRVVGVVVAESFEREYAFGPDEIRLLQTIVGEMGVALENARLFDETQRLLKETEQHNAELAVINSVQSALAAELSIQGIYDAVGDKIREIFHGLDVGIRIYDPATRTVTFPYTLERGARVKVETLRLTDESRGFGPHIFRTGETLLINRDVPGAMERFGSFVMPGTQATEKSMLLVPMVGGAASFAA